MLQARGVIRHVVAVSWEVGGEVAVAMGALVLAGEAAEVSGSPIAGHGATAEPGDGRCVVGEVFDGGVGDVMSGGHEVELAKHSGLLEVAVGDDPRGVFPRDQFGLYGEREGFPPEIGVAVAVKVDPAHSLESGIGGAQQRGVLRDDLSKLRGSIAQVGGEAAEGVETFADELVDADPVGASLVLCPLEGTEQAGGAGDGH